MLSMTRFWLWNIINRMDNLIEKTGRICMYLLALCLTVLTVVPILRPISDVFGRVMGLISILLAIPTAARWYVIKKRS